MNIQQRFIFLCPFTPSNFPPEYHPSFYSLWANSQNLFRYQSHLANKQIQSLHASQRRKYFPQHLQSLTQMCSPRMKDLSFKFRNWKRPKLRYLSLKTKSCQKHCLIRIQPLFSALKAVRIVGIRDHKWYRTLSQEHRHLISTLALYLYSLRRFPRDQVVNGRRNMSFLVSSKLSPIFEWQIWTPKSEVRYTKTIILCGIFELLLIYWQSNLVIVFLEEYVHFTWYVNIALRNFGWLGTY